jgi:predicted  nucleic acid-binding Zn-ribbon protein
MIINIVKETAKDLVAVGQSFGTAVKEEVEMYFEHKKHAAGDFASDARNSVENSKIYNRFEDLEQKVKTTIESTLSNISKDEEFEKIEGRIVSLEDKLTQLIDSLEGLRKEEAKKKK